jgi:hypothetical protein
MFVATVVVSVLLAAALAATALRKLGHRPDVVKAYARVGVPEDKLNALAAVLLAGAVGVLVGLAWPPVGVAAAIGLIGYFLVAVAFHVRAADLGNLPMPLIYEAMAVAVLVLQLVDG